MAKLTSELPWLIGCVAAATAFCWFAPEYGYSPVPFFSLVFYVATGVVRAIVRVVK